MNIMKFRPLFFIISALLLAISLYSLIVWRFQPSIDFVGGSNYQFTSTITSATEFNPIFEAQKVKLYSATKLSSNSWELKFAPVSEPQRQAIVTELKKKDASLTELQFQTLGPSLGRELLTKTLYAIILSSILLFLFIGRRFGDITFGAGAVLAMFHDAIILIGSFSLLGHFFGAELDALFVTALLTTLSSSVHDTIVTFNRIRELKTKHFNLNWVDLSNRAVSETIVRSINNSMTIVIMLASLVVLGGEVTRWFALALLIGVVVGTYSSTGVAIPLVLWFKRKKS
jgi:preprotein translocase subunit SecF